MKKLIYTILLSTVLFSCNKEDIKPNKNIKTEVEHIVTFNVSTTAENWTTVNLNGISNVYYGNEYSLKEIKVKQGEKITIIGENYTTFTTTNGNSYRYYHYTHLDVYVDYKLVFSQGASEPVIFEKTF